MNLSEFKMATCCRLEQMSLDMFVVWVRWANLCQGVYRELVSLGCVLTHDSTLYSKYIDSAFGGLRLSVISYFFICGAFSSAGLIQCFSTKVK